MATTVREEATRKSVHVLVSLVAAAAVWILSPEVAAVIIAGATFVALSVEAARSGSVGFGRLFDRHLGHLLRSRERRRLTGATMLAIAYTGCSRVCLPLPVFWWRASPMPRQPSPESGSDGGGTRAARASRGAWCSSPSSCRSCS